MFRCHLLLISFLICTTAVSQVPGIKAGISITNVKYQGPGKDSAIFRIYAGMNLVVSLSKKFSFVPEILYSGKGYKTPVGYFTGGKTKFDYLAVPLLFSYYPSQQIKILLGPEIGFLLNVTSETQMDPSYEKAFKKVDFSVDLGVKASLGKTVEFEVRYCHGLVDLAEITYADAFGNILYMEKIKGNRAFQAGFVYSIKRKK
jgi:hypothetical protein